MKRILDKINETLLELTPLVTTFVVTLNIVVIGVLVIVGLVKLISLM